MIVLSNVARGILRDPGDPQILESGPSSLSTGDKLARGLGMFTLSLGLLEVIAPKRVARIAGLDGNEGLIRAYGARELSAVIPTISIDKQVGLIMRVLGDGLDIATVVSGLRRGNGKRGKGVATLLLLAAVTALDMYAYALTSSERKRAPGPSRDYSDRSGLPRGIEASRGLARSAPP